MDVDYRTAGAVAAGLWFRGWSANQAEFQSTVSFSDVAAYNPGAFYKRELPCLLAVLANGPRSDVVIVDGYVWLDDGVAGLGARLHATVGGVVVGVAKTRYAGATDVVLVCRGESRSPLFVTAVGMSADDAAAAVAQMHGPYRVPTLLKEVDALARRAGLDTTPTSP